jgi:hypothetical protein
MIVIILLIVLFLFATITYKNKKIGRNGFLLWSALILFFIYILKDNDFVPDVNTYQDYFENAYDIKYLFVYQDFEIGYVGVNLLVRFFTDNFYVFIILYSLILVYANIKTMQRYSVNVWLSVALYICSIFFSLFLLRQYLAIAICILSIPFILDRKPVPFILLTVLASLFHRSAMVWSMTYLIYIFPISKKGLCLILLVGVVGILSMELVIDKLLTVGGSLGSKIESYTTGDEIVYSWKNAAMSLSVLMFYLFALGKKLFRLEGAPKFFFLMYCIAFLLNVINMMGTSFSALYRLEPYFSFSLIYLIPHGILYVKKTEGKLFIAGFFMMLFFYSQHSAAMSQRGFQFLF